MYSPGRKSARQPSATLFRATRECQHLNPPSQVITSPTVKPLARELRKIASPAMSQVCLLVRAGCLCLSIPIRVFGITATTHASTEHIDWEGPRCYAVDNDVTFDQVAANTRVR